ncbi:glycine zipper 2TM domain-containing protein [Albimonas pacifica]|uniref:17 kDa surface antigen n=1 Tax=Albimonas pacifica TaxID=1114924 RepID=A0A1I3ITV7_9RHOB|nr:glycine zipper 2TM domain-containing protein [Albimonas pacifica]SFI51384.1 Glycine zipper 2TM domain-containing protein [Albimonas pacifica]
MTRHATPARLAALALALAALAGCSNVPLDKQTQGQILGGVTGAAVGSLFGGGTGRIVATGAGAVIGTIAGGELAKGM